MPARFHSYLLAMLGVLFGLVASASVAQADFLWNQATATGLSFNSISTAPDPMVSGFSLPFRWESNEYLGDPSLNHLDLVVGMPAGVNDPNGFRYVVPGSPGIGVGSDTFDTTGVAPIAAGNYTFAASDLVLGSLAMDVDVPQTFAPALAGTWKATDAVDDNERAAVIVIRRKGAAYELVDPSIRPRQVLRARGRGNRLTFVQKHGERTTTYTFTLQRGGNALTGDTYDGQSHLGYHFVRVSHRPKHARRIGHPHR